MKTVVITGSSSGIGKAAVLEFAKAGWKVAATMRDISKEKDFTKFSNVTLFELDVADADSVKNSFQKIYDEFKVIDVVVNNAGFAVDGIFEAMSDDIIEKQFNTNVFGLMRVTREAIHLMRLQKKGCIIQIASMGGRLSFPGYSIYHATKWAVEGFTESLQYELETLNIRIKLIEPGAIKTDFYGRSRQFVVPEDKNLYQQYIKKVTKVIDNAGNTGDSPEKVAKVILKAANDNGKKLRYIVGSPAPILLWMRKWIPDAWFFAMVRIAYKL